MNVYCIEAFKSEIEKLVKNNSYASIEQEIINYFFNKSIKELSSGTRLNGSCPNPYIKKRLEGSGGYRVYYLLVIVKDSLFLIHIHPKSGKLGKDNISTAETKAFYKQVLEAINENDLYEVTCDSSRTVLKFNKVVKTCTISIEFKYLGLKGEWLALLFLLLVTFETEVVLLFACLYWQAIAFETRLLKGAI